MEELKMPYTDEQLQKMLECYNADEILRLQIEILKSNDIPIHHLFNKDSLV